LPSSPLLELFGIQYWFDKDRDDFLNQRVFKKGKILTAQKRSKYIKYLQHLDQTSSSKDIKERVRFANKKHYVLKHYEL
jgi:hypothetical protein